jgi:hypothetical protein
VEEGWFRACEKKRKEKITRVAQRDANILEIIGSCGYALIHYPLQSLLTKPHFKEYCELRPANVGNQPLLPTSLHKISICFFFG